MAGVEYCSLAGVVEWIRSRRELGYEIERIILANMGDLTEGVSGSYASQPYSVDLNLRDQLTLGVNLTLEWIRTLAPLVQHFEYAACLCNHGALSRNGGKSNITDESDNAAGLIADTVRKVCDHIPRLSGIESRLPAIEEESAKVAAEYHERLLKRMNDMLAKTASQIDIDQGRLAQEVAYLADRADISEEITRLRTHIDHFRSIMSEDKDVGKRLDFLTQELNREANTITSKTNNMVVKENALAIKSEIEKIREQVQNVE